MKLGLDVDGVLCNFIHGLIESAQDLGMGAHYPEHYTGWDKWLPIPEEHFLTVWNEIKGDPLFWSRLPRFETEIPLPVDCYITSRPIDSVWTAGWLRAHDFPDAPVITVAKPLEKLEHCLERGLDAFVDDHIQTVRHLRENGVNALLWEAHHHVGHDDHLDLPTIKTLSEVLNYVGKEEHIGRG